MKKIVFSAAFVLAAVIASAIPGASPSPYEISAPVRAESEIDKLVFAKLDELKIQPANLCSDAVFVRRVFLDVIGTLPSSQETTAFIQSRDPNKRQFLIDRLMERDEFADYWAMKWSDILRIKAEFPINLWPNAAQAYHRWVRTSIRDNKPYDKFARELLTSSGSNFRVPPVNFYRALQSKDPQTIAQTVALTFMGTRPEKWPKEKLANMAVFFSKIGYKSTSEWKEEIIFFDPGKTNSLAQGDVAPQPVFPDSTIAWLLPDRDPREIFADWLIDEKNPWFARIMVNRMWCWLLGRGIIHEPDDIRPDNPASNPELLTFLEKQFIASHYDMRQLLRLILNSKTYQLSSVAKSDDPRAEVFFAQYSIRRLDAEVLIDALDKITASIEKYTSPIPEPFTFIPEDQRSIALPDGSITSSFLELFGRPSRDTGLEAERNNRPSAAQRLHMLNSSHIQKKIEQSPVVRYLTEGKAQPRELVSNTYLTILSRYPTEEELSVATAKRSREGAVDLTWALLNSPEFLYRH